MRLSVAAVAAGCALVHAFTNTSPFVMFSTSKIPNVVSDELYSSHEVENIANTFVSGCPTERYLLVSQGNLNIQHLAGSTAAPHLQAALASSKVEGRMTVSEMSGNPIDLAALEKRIRDACKSSSPLIERIELEPVPTGDGVRFQDMVDSLRKSDESLGVLLQQYDAAGVFTVVYTAGLHVASDDDTPQQYKPDFHKDPSHQELKRQLSGSDTVRRAREWDRRSLFDKYQFFTPGIFMALVALLVLCSILGVGISALGSLKVPYGAFDKEMGPTAQKKQQ